MVKIEIGKVLAVIITVVVVAMLAAVFMQSSYFKGSLIPGVDCDVWENSVYVPCLEQIEQPEATINADITESEVVEKEENVLNSDIKENKVIDEEETTKESSTRK